MNSGSTIFTKNKLKKSKGKKNKFKGNCYGYGEAGHKSINCPKEKEGKSGQKSSNKDKKDKDKKSEKVAAVMNDEDLFAFTCTSDSIGIAKAHGIMKEDMGAIADSRASQHYCLDKEKFINYWLIANLVITTADGPKLLQCCWGR
jgi:hypothetical protein